MSKGSEFMVSGRGEFPFDMLRRDECWPIDTQSASSMALDNSTLAGFRQERYVHLRSNGAVTIRRWESFGWKVTMIKGRESFPSAFHPAIQVTRAITRATA